MANTLLDYFFKITAINPTPAASTAFLKQVCLVVAPKSGVLTRVPTLCTSMSAVAALTDNTEAQQLFNAGMTRVYILPADDLDLSEVMETYGTDFFTVLISSDFDKDDVNETQAALTKANLTFTAKDPGSAGNDISIEFLDTGTAGSEVVTVTGKKISVSMDGGTSTANQLKTAIDASAQAMALIDPVTVAPGQGSTAQAAFAEDNLEGGDGLFLGVFAGVTGVVSSDLTFLEEQAVIENRCAFYEAGSSNAKNMCFAFGKLLSNSLDWKNQQYIQMPFADDVDEVGEAENLFDNKISFVIDDEEFGARLALFCAGGSAIVAPYIRRNLEIDMQSKALQYVSANMPAYTKKHAALIEDELDKVINGSEGVRGYVQKGWIEEGSVEVLLEQDDFVASGEISIKKPRALWRIVGEITQS